MTPAFHAPSFLSLALMAALAAPVLAQTTESAAPPDAAQMQAAMTDAASFAERAASSNLFEIQSSQLALQLSENEHVRAFANRMIEDHTAAGDRMRQAAQADGVEVPESLMVDHRSQLRNLAELPNNFDQAYLAAQVAAHNEAVSLFEGYAQGGEEGSLRSFAAETAPKLREHLREVTALSGP